MKSFLIGPADLFIFQWLGSKGQNMKNTIYVITLMGLLSGIGVQAQKRSLNVEFLPYKDTIGPYDLLYVNLQWENKTGKKVAGFLPAASSMMQIRRMEPEASVWYLYEAGGDLFGFQNEVFSFSDRTGWYEFPAAYKDERWYQMGSVSPDFSKEYYFFLPGKYECRVVYNPVTRYATDANYPEPCKGCHVRTFQFYVKATYGDLDDAAALRILEWKGKGYSNFWGLYMSSPMDHVPCEERFQFAESFLADFPNSTFAPFVYAFLWNILEQCEYPKYKFDSPEWLKVKEQAGQHYKKAKDSGHPWFNKRD